MDELHRAADKLALEAKRLAQVLAGGDLDPNRTDLALSMAKRVRRDSTLLVRHLAAHRDQLQP